jgi:hypothetical protein
MKLPSVQQVLQGCWQTFLRFPFVLVNALIGTVAIVLLLDRTGPPQPTILYNIMMATILGIPLLLFLALLAERGKWSKVLSFGAQVTGVLLLLAYACTIPTDLWAAPAIFILRQLLLAVALHLLVSFAPYLRTGEYNGFWQYNKTLFLRLVNALIFAVVLYAGLSLALAALDNLFGMNVPIRRYGELWIIINGLFTTWFFLAGVPHDWTSLENSSDYPKVIKIFAQYILFPLVLVYLVILYAYLIKIVVDWNWPRGWVSRLILGFSATGIFSLLLLYPIREKVENIWIRRSSKWFYIVMIPLLFMLFPAVWIRISEYGITEGRYIAVTLSIWLAAIVIYFILSKIKSIKIIPISLSILAFIISFGPWGAFAVSENSQVNRLKVLLTTNSILVADKVQKAPAAVPADDVKQISSILAYLQSIHGYECIQPWFTASLKADSTGRHFNYLEPAEVAQLMGIEYINIWYSPEGNDLHFSADEKKFIDIHGYDHMIGIWNMERDQRQEHEIGENVSYRISTSLDTITFLKKAEGKPVDSLLIDLHPLVDKLMNDYSNINVNNIPPGIMMLDQASLNMNVKIYLRYLNLHREDKNVKIVSYGADILF